jgi:hypothetical protein
MPFRKKYREKARALLKKTRETIYGQGSSSTTGAGAKTDDNPELTGEGGKEVRIVT